ncbi:MAG: nucleotidyltransferase family protein [Wenzhouxiangellaceae bacterium]
MSEPILQAAVLAAGASRRLGQSKQLVKYRGETLLNRALRIAARLSGQPPLVILGCEAEKLDSTLTQPALVVHNDDWEQGQGSSIHAAIKATPAQADALLLMTVDQWAIPELQWLSMLGMWRQEPQAPVAAAYAETLGIPAIFPRQRFADLAALRPQDGAKPLLLDWRDTIMVSMPAAAMDLDTPADLAVLEQQAASGDDIA